ncbi:MAG: hypothetical protein HY647_03125 [Acidobacteria bacterium]|nr:hypothetical protein [Acidobacteriota bacterium]
MKSPYKYAVWTFLLAFGWIASGFAQQSQPTQKPGEPLKIEGEITEVQMKPTAGPPFLVVKTTEGEQYLVPMGPMRELDRQGFSPKVGDKVTVSGQLCCVFEGRQMLHSTEIVLGGKTYSLAVGPGMGWAGGRRGPPAAAGPGGGPCWSRQTSPSGGCWQSAGCPWWQ